MDKKTFLAVVVGCFVAGMAAGFVVRGSSGETTGPAPVVEEKPSRRESPVFSGFSSGMEYELKKNVEVTVLIWPDPWLDEMGAAFQTLNLEMMRKVKLEAGAFLPILDKTINHAGDVNRWALIAFPANNAKNSERTIKVSFSYDGMAYSVGWVRLGALAGMEWGDRQAIMPSFFGMAHEVYKTSRIYYYRDMAQKYNYLVK